MVKATPLIPVWALGSGLWRTDGYDGGYDDASRLQTVGTH